MPDLSRFECVCLQDVSDVREVPNNQVILLFLLVSDCAYCFGSGCAFCSDIVLNFDSLQEVFQDPDRDESFIIELLELKENVTDVGSARWFLQDLAVEQASENSLVCRCKLFFSFADDTFLNKSCVRG